MQGYSPGQIRKHIKQLRQREQEYIYYLGWLAYQAGEEGKLEAGPMLDAYRTLRDIREQAARWEAYLNEMQAARVVPQAALCPRCGNPVPPQATRCPYCGQQGSAVQGRPTPVPWREPSPHGVPPGTVYPRDTVVTAPGAPPGPPASPAGPRTAGPSMPHEVPASPGAGMSGDVSGVVPSASTVGAAAEAESRSSSTCPSCGGDLEPDAFFCGHCGTRVRTDSDVTRAGQEMGTESTPLMVEEQAEAQKEEAREGEASGGATTVTSSEEAESWPEGSEGMPRRDAADFLPCPSCGKLVDEPDARFCPDCGARLRE